MRTKIRNYIAKINSFDLFTYFIKKKVLMLENKKSFQENIIDAFKTRINKKIAENKVLEGRILDARNLIKGYRDQLENLNVVVEMYE